MSRTSIAGGVIPAGANRIRFDFKYEGVRYRPTLENAKREQPALGAAAPRGNQTSHCGWHVLIRRGVSRLPPSEESARSGFTENLRPGFRCLPRPLRLAGDQTRPGKHHARVVPKGLDGF